MKREPSYVKRYAGVLFNFAGRFSREREYAASLASFVAMIDSDATVHDYFMSRSVPRQAKRDLVLRLWPEEENLALREVASLVAARNGAEWLKAILGHFNALLDSKSGISRATLETAFPAGDELLHYAGLKAGELHPEMTVRFETRMEKQLTGGFRLVSGDNVIDASVAARFRLMRERFGIA